MSLLLSTFWIAYRGLFFLLIITLLLFVATLVWPYPVCSYFFFFIFDYAKGGDLFPQFSQKTGGASTNHKGMGSYKLKWNIQQYISGKMGKLHYIKLWINYHHKKWGIVNLIKQAKLDKRLLKIYVPFVGKKSKRKGVKHAQSDIQRKIGKPRLEELQINSRLNPKNIWLSMDSHQQSKPRIKEAIKRRKRFKSS